LVAPPATPETNRSQTLNVGVTVGLGVTDNVFETQANARTQTLALTGIDFGWIRTGSQLEANVIGNFDYLYFPQGAYPSYLLGRFDGQTSLSLFEDHLKWYLQDDFGDGQLDPFTPATPTNLERINDLTTGPEFMLRPTSDTMLQAGARYAIATYETSPLNGSRTVENVMLQHQLSPHSDVALGADAEQLRFDNTILNPDYDRSRFYARYDLTGVRTQVTVVAGETQSNDGGARVATPLVQFNLTHAVTPETSVNVTAGRELTDAADAFSDVRSGAAGGVAVAPVAQTTEDYLRSYATGALQFTARRTTLGASVYWERDTYAIDDIFDVTRASLELRAGRQLSEVLSASIFGMIMRSQYFNQGGDINTHTLGADITWQAGRTLSVEGRYFHDFQSTAGSGFGFSANTVFVTVTYRPALSGEVQQEQLKRQRQELLEQQEHQ
jgi:hypothetical protein